MPDYQQLNILEMLDQTIIGLYLSKLKTKNIFKFPDAFKQFDFWKPFSRKLSILLPKSNCNQFPPFKLAYARLLCLCPDRVKGVPRQFAHGEL